MSTAVSSYEEIVNHAVSVADDTAKTLPSQFPEGSFVRQGDIYLYFFTQCPPLKLTLQPKPEAQLAQGTSQGSRHTLNSLDSVRMYQVTEGDALQGPVFQVFDPVTVTHPEHGDVIISAESLQAGPIWCVVTYQRDLAEVLRATRD
jgi:hypothetical protein